MRHTRLRSNCENNKKDVPIEAAILRCKFKKCEIIPITAWLPDLLEVVTGSNIFMSTRSTLVIED